MQYSVTYQTSEIYYTKKGSGFPVVFIHGFAEDSHVWNYQVDYLQQYYTVIVPDLPGSGNSAMLQPASGSGDVTIADYADCVHAVLQHENIGSCIMLGHSMGGYITLAFAEKHPELVRGFGFVHSTAFADSEEKKGVRLKGINTIEQYGSYAFIKSTTPNLFAKKYKAEHGDKIEELIEQGKQFSQQSLQQYYKAMMLRQDKTDVLRNSKVPVLFIMGEEDVAAPLGDVLQQVHLPAISYIHVVKNAGHMGMWEATDEVNRYILQFATDVTSVSLTAI